MQAIIIRPTNRKRLTMTRMFRIFSTAVALGMMSQPASAQGIDFNSLISEQALEQLDGELNASESGWGGNDSGVSERKATTDTNTRARQQVELLQPSPLEQDYSERLQPIAGSTVADQQAQTMLPQFGYDALLQPVSDAAAPAGALGDDYVVRVGDKVMVTLRGETSSNKTIDVQRDGTIVIADLPPLDVAGKTLGQVRGNLQQLVKSRLGNTDVYINIGSIRAIGVLVTGNVLSPGLKSLTSLSSVLEAVQVAGGIKKNGTLRNLKLIRAGKTISIDLYQLLLSGQSTDYPLLQDGDRILVPGIGNTIAVAGDVNRPGVYELPAGVQQVGAATALQYGGNALRLRGNHYLRLGFDTGNVERVQDLGNIQQKTLIANDILLVQRQQQRQIGAVYLEGHVYNPGQRALVSTPTVRALVGSLQNLKQDPYLLFAALMRNSGTASGEKITPVNLETVLHGGDPVALQDQDRLVVFSRDDIKYLWSSDVQSVLAGKTPASLLLASNAENKPANSGTAAAAPSFPAQTTLQQQQLLAAALASKTRASFAAAGNPSVPAAVQTATPTFQESGKDTLLVRAHDDVEFMQTKVCRGLLILLQSVRSQGIDHYKAALLEDGTLDNGKTAMLEGFQTCPAIYDQFPDTLPLLLDHVVTVTGAVQQPGIYPVAQQAVVPSIIAGAGGMTVRADTGSIRLTQAVRDGGVGSATVAAVDITLDNRTAVATVAAGDALTVNQLSSDGRQGIIELQGEFRRPGKYVLTPRETLSSLMDRAGGLTENAYPYGAIFTRASIRQAERESFDRLARQLESAMVSSVDEIRGEGNPEIVIQTSNRLIQSLRETPALGRMVIEADPTVLAARPELDVLLEPGDKLLVPSRPFYVMVAGDVLSQGARQYRPEMSPEQYIQSAGGFQKSADEDRLFLILPNGEAKPLEQSFWNYRSVNVPPGSTIVVPTDPINPSVYSIVRDASTILNQFALTAASLAVISRN